MKIKPLAQFSTIAILTALSLATSAQAQGGRYDDGRGYGYRRMFKAFEFCLPTNAAKVPAGPEWLHEA
jgi:hypothetical protein